MRPRLLTEILDDMSKHTLENPTHGFNCACKDKFVSEIRQLIATPERKAEFRLVATYLLRS